MATAPGATMVWGEQVFDSTKSSASASHLSAEVLDLLDAMDGFVIKQRIKLWEAVTQGCVEQVNTYDVYDARTGVHTMVAQEKSDSCNRCFCAPCHSFYVEFKPVSTGDEVRNAAEIYNPENMEFPMLPNKAETMSTGLIMGLGTAMTMEREGCCSKPCLNCWICCDGCADSGDSCGSPLTC